MVGVGCLVPGPCAVGCGHGGPALENQVLGKKRETAPRQVGAGPLRGPPTPPPPTPLTRALVELEAAEPGQPQRQRPHAVLVDEGGGEVQVGEALAQAADHLAEEGGRGHAHGGGRMVSQPRL